MRSEKTERRVGRTTSRDRNTASRTAILVPNRAAVEGPQPLITVPHADPQVYDPFVRTWKRVAGEVRQPTEDDWISRARAARGTGRRRCRRRPGLGAALLEPPPRSRPDPPPDRSRTP